MSIFNLFGKKEVEAVKVESSLEKKLLLAVNAKGADIFFSQKRYDENKYDVFNTTNEADKRGVCLEKTFLRKSLVEGKLYLVAIEKKEFRYGGNIKDSFSLFETNEEVIKGYIPISGDGFEISVRRDNEVFDNNILVLKAEYHGPNVTENNFYIHIENWKYRGSGYTDEKIFIESVDFNSLREIAYKDYLSSKVA